MKKQQWIYFILLLAAFLVACDGQTAEDATPEPEAEGEVATDSADDTSTEVAVEEDTAVDDSTESSEESSEETDTEESSDSGDSAATVTATTDLNIRSGPGTAYTAVSVLNNGQSANVLGKSSDGGWWKIACPDGGDPCWVSAGSQFSTSNNTDDVPVAAAPAIDSGDDGSSDEEGSEATAVPEEDATDVPDEESTPVPDEESTPVPDEEPTSEPIEEPTDTPPEEPTNTPAEEPVEAAFDNDSLQNPAQDVFLSITGTRNFSHQSDISFAGGDNEDFVAFEFPNNSNSSQTVWITLDCALSGDVGNAQMVATILEDGVEKSGTTVFCNGGEQQLTVDNTKKQTVRIYYNITNEGVYGTYTLTVVGFN